MNKGYSLINLLISMSLGLIILGGLSHLYLQSQFNYQTQTSRNNLHSEGQYALSQILQDLQQAGYLGETVSPLSITGTTPPLAATLTCDQGNQWARMLAQPIYGMNDTLAVDETTSYEHCINKRHYLRGDILALRFVSKDEIPLSDAYLKDNANRFYLLSAPRQGRLFQGKDLAENKIDNPLKTLREVQGSIYYVAKAIVDRSNQCTHRHNYPALYRKRINKQGKLQQEEISQGVEQLQIQYGLDIDGDGSVNAYQHASPKLNWQHIVSVKIWLLIKASCPEIGYNNNETYLMGDQTYTPKDNYRRLLLSTTSSLNY